MKIGVIIGRIGGLDGVALETQKWLYVLRKLGHDICVLTGELEGQITFPVHTEPLLAFSHPQCIKEQREVFFQKNSDEKEILADITEYSDSIQTSILAWLSKQKIDFLLVENAISLPFHLSLGIALNHLLNQTQIPSIAHDHDFYWERGCRYHTRFPSIMSMIEDSFPPVLKNLKHVVINSFAERTLFEKFEIRASVIPNVMDFDRPFALEDEWNFDIKSKLGLKEKDIVLAQVTRMVRRKGIETAIELVSRLDNPNVKLVITGSDKDESTDGSYLRELEQLVCNKKLQSQILFASDFFDANRSRHNGRKIYSLEDAYTLADAVTYFSTYEGFGNAFVEAVLAKKPVLVNNYKPVYWPDIGSKGFITVQIENGVLDDASVFKVAELLKSPSTVRTMTETNFELGKRYFSFTVLTELLYGLLQEIGKIFNEGDT